MAGASEWRYGEQYRFRFHPVSRLWLELLSGGMESSTGFVSIGLVAQGWNFRVAV